MKPLLAMLCLLLVVGCVNPPVNTTFVKDANDKITSLAWDKNQDGIPDQILQTTINPVTGESELVLGPDGQPVLVADVVPGSTGYGVGEAIDTVGPATLGILATLVPGGIGAILAGLAGAWRLSRFGRIFNNTVMSIQIARQRLKDGGLTGSLKLLDEAVKSGQLQATIDEIAKIKEAMGLPSVSDSAPLPGSTFNGQPTG